MRHGLIPFLLYTTEKVFFYDGLEDNNASLWPLACPVVHIRGQAYPSDCAICLDVDVI
jgi:hypothetical protein